MLNLSRNDLRLLLAALKDAKYFNEQVRKDGKLGRDDRYEAKMAVEDFDRMYSIIHSEFMSKG